MARGKRRRSDDSDDESFSEDDDDLSYEETKKAKKSKPPAKKPAPAKKTGKASTATQRAKNVNKLTDALGIDTKVTKGKGKTKKDADTPAPKAKATKKKSTKKEAEDEFGETEAVQKAKQELHKLDSKTAQKTQDLLSHAYANGMIGASVATEFTPKAVADVLPKLTEDCDVIKKNTQKKRYLFMMPGKISIHPNSEGKTMGRLENLDTPTPTLFIHTEQGRMKFEGSLVYPNNSYLRMQHSRNKMMLDDSYESIVVFSKYTWVGLKSANPDDEEKPIPDDLFNGAPPSGAGIKRNTTGASANAFMVPNTQSADDTQEEGDIVEAPMRQSSRPMREAGKKALEAIKEDEENSGGGRGAGVSSRKVPEAPEARRPAMTRGELSSKKMADLKQILRKGDVDMSNLLEKAQFVDAIIHNNLVTIVDEAASASTLKYTSSDLAQSHAQGSVTTSAVRESPLKSNILSLLDSDED